MKLEWDGKLGPAAVIGAVGMLVQAGVVVWAISAFKTNVDNHFASVDGKFVEQATAIKKVDDGSNERFRTVHTAIANAQQGQVDLSQKVVKVDTLVGTIYTQVQQLVTRLDGKP